MFAIAALASRFQSFLIVGGLAAFLSGFGTGIVVHKIDAAKYATLELSVADAKLAAVTEAKVIQAQQDAVVLDAAVREASAQTLIAQQSAAVLQEVKDHVAPEPSGTREVPEVSQPQPRGVRALLPRAKPARPVAVASAGGSTCVPFGLVRVLDAAALGLHPSALALPAGKSDADCTTIDYVALATNVIGNYGAARANAEQLNALIGSVRAVQEAGP